jgi:hypothetical protein
VGEKAPQAWVAIDDTAHNVRNIGDENKVVVHDRCGLTAEDVKSVLDKLAAQKV